MEVTKREFEKLNDEKYLREPDTFEITGYEVIEKIARATGTTAHVFVPVSWVGKRVKIVRIEP